MIDRPYRYRRPVLFVIGAATGLLDELMHPPLSAPPFGGGFLEVMFSALVCAAFGYWIGAHGLRRFHGFDGGFGAPISKFLLGHSSLALLIADVCFAFWGEALCGVCVDALFQRWPIVSFGIPTAAVAVGLFVGVRPTVRAEERKRRRASGQCIHCGYDLTGNVSGRCPECGEGVDGEESQA